MSPNKKPFWTTLPGILTGIASLLTALAGLLGLLVQLNVIHSGGGAESNSTAQESEAARPAR